MVLDDKLLKKRINALAKLYPAKGLSTGTLFVLLIYTIGMITLPLSAFYLFSYLSHGSSSIAAAAAIVTVHIIVFAFVYKASKEGVAQLELKEEWSYVIRESLDVYVYYW